LGKAGDVVIRQGWSWEWLSSSLSGKAGTGGGGLSSSSSGKTVDKKKIKIEAYLLVLVCWHQYGVAGHCGHCHCWGCCVDIGTYLVVVECGWMVHIVDSIWML